MHTRTHRSGHSSFGFALPLALTVVVDAIHYARPGPRGCLCYHLPAGVEFRDLGCVVGFRVHHPTCAYDGSLPRWRACMYVSMYAFMHPPPHSTGFLGSSDGVIWKVGLSPSLTRILSVSTCVAMYVCMYVCMNACMHAVCMHVCMHA